MEDHFSNPSLNKTLQRLRYMMLDFSSSLFFHILRGSNKEADFKENLGCLLPQGAYNKNDEYLYGSLYPALQLRKERKLYSGSVAF